LDISLYDRTIILLFQASRRNWQCITVHVCAVASIDSQWSRPVVPKVCSANPKVADTNSQGNPWIYFCDSYFEVC